MKQENEKSSHILNASPNLLGICFIVLTSLKVPCKSEKTIIHEITVVAIVLFMASCIFSFLSIRGIGKGVLCRKVLQVLFFWGTAAAFCNNDPVFI